MLGIGHYAAEIFQRNMVRRPRRAHRRRERQALGVTTIPPAKKLHVFRGEFDTKPRLREANAIVSEWRIHGVRAPEVLGINSHRTRMVESCSRRVGTFPR